MKRGPALQASPGRSLPTDGFPERTAGRRKQPFLGICSKHRVSPESLRRPMSEPLPSESAPEGQESPAEELQFDNAEFTSERPGALSCAACQKEIDATYYEVNGKTVCASCRAPIEAHRASGSRVERFARATVFGAGAAAVGGAIYYAVTRATGREFALVSILVGFMVGAAVRKGSWNRGGRVYQALALFLTYF